jgi:hypothetical protein
LMSFSRSFSCKKKPPGYGNGSGHAGRALRDTPRGVMQGARLCTHQNSLYYRKEKEFRAIIIPGCRRLRRRTPL